MRLVVAFWIDGRVRLIALLLMVVCAGGWASRAALICREAAKELARIRQNTRDYYRPRLSDAKTADKPRDIHIKSWAQGIVDDPALVGRNKQAMLEGQFDYPDAEKVVSGYYDPRTRTYYVGEGHHRFAAALEIAKEDGNWAPFKQLLNEGVWEVVEKPPATPKRLPVRSTLWTSWGWAKFLQGIE